MAGLTFEEMIAEIRPKFIFIAPRGWSPPPLMRECQCPGCTSFTLHAISSLAKSFNGFPSPN